MTLKTLETELIGSVLRKNNGITIRCIGIQQTPEGFRVLSVTSDGNIVAPLLQSGLKVIIKENNNE